ncbi:MAG: RsmB/NOP family class I SAM-dependent RNA methyltransferase [Pseudomonadota bacterium]
MDNKADAKPKKRKRPSAKSSAPPPKTADGSAPREVAGLLLTRALDDKRSFAGLTDAIGGLAAFLALSEQDRNLARAIARTGLARRGQIELALKRVSDRPPPKGARHLIHTLHAAAAQILFMDVPDSAAVNVAVNIIAREPRSARFVGFANAVLRRLSREKDELEPKLRSDKLNTPKWMYARWAEAYGHQTARAIATHHATVHAESVPLDLSVKGAPADYLATHRTALPEAVLLDNGTIRLPRAVDVRSLPGWDDGAVWVQDAAARLPAQLVQAQPNERIADLCAAPGGKTAQLALSGASVTAVEQSRPRMERLRANLERLQIVDSVTLHHGDLFELETTSGFDAVLLDAPCSSTGTIRRHPDILWTKTQSDIADLADLQFRMIAKAADLLKSGGRLVFSNCSLDHLEGEMLHERVLKELGDVLQHQAVGGSDLPGFAHAVTEKGTVRSLPHLTPTAANALAHGGADGFFAARYRRR